MRPFSSADAIIRSLTRLFVTHRRLLEWETASDAQRRAGNRLGAFVGSMAMEPLLALATLALLTIYRPEQTILAAIFLGAWLLSPAIAWLISQPLKRKEARLSRHQQQLLRVVARKTWRFFDTFVTAEDHYLPPDNFQEYPAPVTAHRTSPTNIGLGMLSTLAAYDFGYLSAGDLLERTRQTFETLGKMNRHRGHFYNWYDTRTLQPMPPLYVSTVDSGNLAGLLMTFRQGILELPDLPVVGPRTFEGIGDTILILSERIHKGVDESESGINKNAATEIQNTIDWMLEQTAGTFNSLSSAVSLLEQFASRATKIEQLLKTTSDDELRWASSALVQQCRALQDDILFLAPWVKQSAGGENIWAAVSGAPDLNLRLLELEAAFRKLDRIPTTRALAAIHLTLLPSMDLLLLEALAENSTTARNPGKGLRQLRDALAEAADRAMQRCTTCEALAAECDLFTQMDFQFLFDKSREQLAIGFNVADRRRDASFYDLLASESRLGSFVAIAQDQLPQESWFALGRNLTAAARQPALLSWSGSMFEYLMPLLVMPTYDDTLLDQTYHAVVARQIQYGHERAACPGAFPNPATT